MYVLGVDYPIPPLSYIPLDVYTLPSTIANGIQGTSNVQGGHGSVIPSHSKSMSATSSHHHSILDDLWVIGCERSIGSPWVPSQRGQEVGETSGQGGGKGSAYEDALEE